MKWCAYVFAAASLLASPATKTFTGTIHDNRCVGPACATQCPVRKTPTYTLQAGDDAWVLSDQKTPAQYNGKKVIVTGTIGPDNKLRVVSIKLQATSAAR
jgi:hypothetical protein